MCDVCGREFTPSRLLVEDGMTFCQTCYKDRTERERRKEYAIFESYCDLADCDDGPSKFEPSYEDWCAWELYNGPGVQCDE